MIPWYKNGSLHTVDEPCTDENGNPVVSKPLTEEQKARVAKYHEEYALEKAESIRRDKVTEKVSLLMKNASDNSEEEITLKLSDLKDMIDQFDYIIDNA